MRLEKRSIRSFVYDGANLLEEVDGAGAPVVRYTQGLGIDEPLAQLRSGATTYYEADGLGSITSLTSSSGAVVNTYIYDSYGRLTAASGNLPSNTIRYTAREAQAVGITPTFYYYRARYYDWQVGRFISEDPIRFDAGVNFYAYVLNNPVNYTDPDGLRTRVCCRPVTGGLHTVTREHHCFIAITGNPRINSGKNTTFSLFPGKNYDPVVDSGTGVPSPSDLRDLTPFNANQTRCTDVPDCDSCKEVRISNNYRDAGPSRHYRVDGPNSNTYVRYQLLQAGCTPPVEPPLTPAAGYKYPLPLPKLR